MHRQSVSPNAFKPCMILSIPEPLTAKQYQSLETRSNLSRVVTPGVKGGFQACFLRVAVRQHPLPSSVQETAPLRALTFRLPLVMHLFARDPRKGVRRLELLSFASLSTPGCSNSVCISPKTGLRVLEHRAKGARLLLLST